MVRTRHGSKTEARVEPPATLPALSPAPNSKLPAQLRFPLLVLMTWILFGTLWSTISPFTAGDLATVSRSRDDWGNIVGLMVWKAALVAVGWYGGYDSMQMPFTEVIGHRLTLFYQARILQHSPSCQRSHTIISLRLST